MIREKQERVEQVIIDLTGPEGNAFFLLARAQRFSNQLGLDGDSILNEMKSSDYENLIQVFDRYFGDWVILER
jgi:hypothetical protein